MTWLLSAASIVLAIGICAWRVWATSRDKIRQRETDMSWPGKPMRIIEHGPADLPYWAGDRKP